MPKELTNNKITIKSYAKINLFLEIIGKNSNDYHLLQSIICFIDIFDIITFEKSNKLSLNISGKYANFLQNDNSPNIILKTINLMSRQFNISPNFKISLKKNTPIGAGLGGGSSNGASIILAINELYQLNLNDEELLKIALEIGCDVPICMNNHIALTEGIGEKITSLKINEEPLFCIIINPNIHISTKEIFSNRLAKYRQNQKIIVENKKIIDLIKNRENDLESTAIKLAPIIQIILGKIKKQQNCLISRMSGSGSSCFGLFKDKKDLEVAYQNLKNDFPDFYIEKTKLIYDKI